MVGGAGVPLLSRMTSPRTTNVAGSCKFEIDDGPFGADRSTHAMATRQPTATRFDTARRFTEVSLRGARPTRDRPAPPDRPARATLPAAPPRTRRPTPRCAVLPCPLPARAVVVPAHTLPRAA